MQNRTTIILKTKALLRDVVIFWPKSCLSHNFLVYQLFLQFIIKKLNLKLHQSPYWLQQDHNRIEELPQHACWSWGVSGLPWHPQIFADQLTLYQPGRQIMTRTSRIERFSLQYLTLMGLLYTDYLTASSLSPSLKLHCIALHCNDNYFHSK